MTVKKTTKKTARKFPAKKNAYEVTAELILEIMESTNTLPWQKPWNNGASNMGATGHTYRGWNAMFTAYVASARGYKSPVWATFLQIKKQGCTLKDARDQGVKVVCPLIIDKDAKGNKLKDPKFCGLKTYTVFNLDLVEGDFKVPKKAKDATNEENDHTEILTCEQVVSSYVDCPAITHGSSGAAYNPRADTIRMPSPESFKSSEEYYCTLFHEMAHSTGHEAKLNRPGVTDPIKFGSHKYGQEELIAEFTASFLCGTAGIGERTISNSAAYIAGWKKTIKADNSIVLKAIAAAQKAADRVLGLTAPVFKKETSAA